MQDIKEKIIRVLQDLGPWLAPIILGVVFFYFIVLGLLLFQRVDDDPEFVAPEITANGSATIDIAAALIDREVNIHEWMPNEPWFMSGSWLTRTPAYQSGIVMGLRRFVMAGIDHLARQRGSSQSDADLQAAQASLNFHMDRWVPTPADLISPSTEKEYRNAIKALRGFNKRLSEGSAVFDKRADNLQSALDSIAADLGSQSAVLADHIAQKGGGLLEFESNRVFFANKGRLYAYYLIMRELGHDFADVIKEKGLTSIWQNTVSSLRSAAMLHPLIIFNGKGDSQFLPCHLCGQGFELLRARTQLREVSNILVK